jgi:hypothetical protein
MQLLGLELHLVELNGELTEDVKENLKDMSDYKRQSYHGAPPPPPPPIRIYSVDEVFIDANGTTPSAILEDPPPPPST